MKLLVTAGCGFAHFVITCCIQSVRGGGVWNHLQNKKLPVAVRKQLPDDIPLCLQGVKRKVLLVLRHDHLCKNSHGSSLGMSDLFVLWGK
jgi:hypothetical protein